MLGRLCDLGQLDLSIPFASTPDGGVSVDWIRLSSGLSELGLPFDEYTFDYWGATPLTVFLPALLLGTTTLISGVIILFKPILQTPLLTILERLDGSEKRILDQVALALIAFTALITAVNVYK